MVCRGLASRAHARPGAGAGRASARAAAWPRVRTQRSGQKCAPQKSMCGLLCCAVKFCPVSEAQLSCVGVPKLPGLYRNACAHTPARPPRCRALPGHGLAVHI